MAQPSMRERKAKATRMRIAETALALFLDQGYEQTTIDQIAQAADVGRRTVFHHFPNKEAILFDHLVQRREVSMRLLEERPLGEPPLVSLHAVLRDLSEQGFDRRLALRVRAVLDANPGLGSEELSTGTRAFQKSLMSGLLNRLGEEHRFEIRALTLMAVSWFDAAARAYYTEGTKSLVEYFDEVVATCFPSTVNDLAKQLRGGADSVKGQRQTRR